jgi:hypothetical protein
MEYFFRLSKKNVFGSAFNGQSKRQEIFRDIADHISLSAIIETGTHRGSTAEFFLKNTFLPVYSVELNPRYYFYARYRLRNYERAHLFLGDSVSFLTSLKEKAGASDHGVFFYLDSHWGERLPLKEEVDSIAKAYTESIIMIDDYQVPGDPGYGFDYEGGSNSMRLKYLQFDKRSDLAVFFPMARSSEETGCRRGCVVLVTKDSMLEQVKTLRTLRQWNADPKD